MRQLVVSISNTELPILEFALLSIGAGKLTNKGTSKTHHTPSYAYALWNRQALALLAQVEPYMRSYKRERTARAEGLRKADAPQRQIHGRDAG
jgi:hypothetical protein